MENIFEIVTIKSLSDNYIWLLRNNIKNLTAVIDPSDDKDVNEVLLLKNWHLNQIVNTHHHFDHTNGNLKLKNKWKAELIGPEEEKDKIKSIDRYVSDGDKTEIAGLDALVIHTPGHTLGHVMYYLKNEKILFAGDTIFSLGCGRVFEGTMNDMFSSLNKIKELDPKTLIYCGHEYTENNLKFALEVNPNNKNLKTFSKKIYKLINAGKPTVPSLLEDELKCNPFLQTENDEISNYFDEDKLLGLELFSKLRELKDKF